MEAMEDLKVPAAVDFSASVESGPREWAVESVGGGG